MRNNKPPRLSQGAGPGTIMKQYKISEVIHALAMQKAKALGMSLQEWVFQAIMEFIEHNNPQRIPLLASDIIFCKQKYLVLRFPPLLLEIFEEHCEEVREEAMENGMTPPPTTIQIMDMIITKIALQVGESNARLDP